MMCVEIVKNIIPIIPSLLWFFLVICILIIFKDGIHSIVSALLWRIRSGAGIKIASVELSPTYVSSNQPIPEGTHLIEEQKDINQIRYQERGNYYLPNRDLFLVHKLVSSTKPDQLYDVLIYLIPHKNATLSFVQKVEYYFGPYWDNRIFTSTDRAKGFAISTSAFGPFVCTAELHFTDGQTSMIWRYIDFEMGQFGKVV